MSTQIAKTSGGNCSGRAISTMRLALGYKQGCPANWENGSKEVYELISLLGDCFPNHAVLVCCIKEEADNAIWAKNVNYLGDTIKFNETGGLNTDKYLFAFAYADHGTKDAHMVIGTPVIYNPEAFRIPLIFAVSIENA